MNYPQTEEQLIENILDTMRHYGDRDNVGSVFAARIVLANTDGATPWKVFTGNYASNKAVVGLIRKGVLVRRPNGYFQLSPSYKALL